MAVSLERMRELEEQVKAIPMLQVNTAAIISPPIRCVSLAACITCPSRSKRREAVITSALNRNRPPILLINPSRSSRTE